MDGAGAGTVVLSEAAAPPPTPRIPGAASGGDPPPPLISPSAVRTREAGPAATGRRGFAGTRLFSEVLIPGLYGRNQELFLVRFITEWNFRKHATELLAEDRALISMTHCHRRSKFPRRQQAHCHIFKSFDSDEREQESQLLKTAS